MTPQQVIYSTAIGGGMPPILAALMVAQAAHETGNFTSRFFKEYNNAFGYSYAGSKYQLGPGPLADNQQPIARYASVQDSTLEIVAWIKRRQQEGKFPSDLSAITSPDQYAGLLKAAGYYGDTLANYAAGLKRYYTAVMEMIRENAEPFSVMVGGVLLVGVAWAIMKKK